MPDRSPIDYTDPRRARLCDDDGIVRQGHMHHGTDYECTGSAHFAGDVYVCTSPAHEPVDYRYPAHQPGCVCHDCPAAKGTRYTLGTSQRASRG